MTTPLLPAHKLSAVLAPHVGEIAIALLGERNRQLSSASEWRWRTRGSLAIAVKGRRQGLWFDHELGIGGDALSLIQREQRCSFQEALLWASSWLQIAPTTQPPTALSSSSKP